MDPSSNDTVLAGETVFSDRPAPKPGDQFAGRYRVERVVGRGGMATVYRVFDEMVHEPVALKILDLDPATDVVSRFRQEVRLSRRITHQNVARTHDIGAHDGLHYLTMEFIDGPSLAKRLDNEGRPELEDALRMLLHIADGLGAAHSAGIVHRDLKPENVLMHPCGRAVVTDFGIAGAIGGKSDGTTLSGTPLYMAPEQVLGQQTDARSDVYTLGLVGYELLAGRTAFRGDTPLQAALARLDEAPPELPEGLPEEIRRFVGRCLSREPEGRPIDGEQAAEELAGLIAAFQGRVRETISPTPAWTREELERLTPVPSPEGHPVGQRIAVLPLSVRGGGELPDMAAALGDELLDVLGKTHGLDVLSSGTVRHEDPDADPRRVGRDLGATHVVEGGVTGVGDRMRVTIRLLDGGDGTQRFSERFEATIDDPFDTADRVARRIAESLRVELSIAASEPVHPRARDLYTQSRKDIRRMNISVATVEPLEECLELAPDFAPALAAHALACLRSWFSPGLRRERDWAQAVRESINRAVEFAESQPETQVAVGRLAIQEGRWRQAAQALRRAIKMAPTLPDARAILGLLQVEAGRTSEGLASLRHAYELDAATTQYFYEAARCAALVGDRERYENLLQDVRRESGAIPAALLELRVACWYNEPEIVRNLLDEVTFFPNDPSSSALMAGYVGCVLGDIDPLGFYETFNEIVLRGFSPRFAAVGLQMAAEVLARDGHLDAAQDAINRAADTVLLDILWMERCPVLEPLRERADFRAAKKKVKTRAEAIWAG